MKLERNYPQVFNNGARRALKGVVIKITSHSLSLTSSDASKRRN